ncbi:MAG TPA: hypothetical protein VGN08_00325 [Solirubrobacteraceae bacterium]|jgi:hypothetical protein
MATAADTTSQVSREAERRSRLAVPALAGGVLYLLGSIIIAGTLKGAPTVGLFQGLAPALRGEANPVESPRAAEVRFISHHAFALIAGSILAAMALLGLTLVLLVILDATRFRRPQTWSAARPLVLVGGIALAVVSVGHQVATAIQTHNFAVGHNLTNHAVDQALTKGTVNEIVDYVDLLAGLSFAAGMVGVMINALRVGLLPRWLALLGMLTAVLIFLPIGGAELEVIPAFWLVMVGILFAGRWPGGDPPAWAAGEARPWPTAAEKRAERGTAAGRGPVKAPQPAVAGTAADLAPATGPSAQGARRRRRKRGRRG